MQGLESSEPWRPHTMLSSHPDAVAVRSPGHAQSLGPPGWVAPGLTAQLPSQEGFPSPMLAHRDNEEWKITLRRLERSTARESTMCLWSIWPEQVRATPPLKGCLEPDETITREPRDHQSLLSEVSSSLLLLNVGSQIYSMASEGLDTAPWESLRFSVNHHWHKCTGCIFCLWETASRSPAWQKGARGFGKQQVLLDFLQYFQLHPLL